MKKRKDHKRVGEIIRKEFCDLYVTGCNEHYLVHVDYQVIGNIMYEKAKLVDKHGEEIPAKSGGV
ncbi:MAG: hypothetical protein PHX37_01055 [Eubacteriales bacterium]|nr:hypothetical protein [Eubacteriales bacterium]